MGKDKYSLEPAITYAEAMAMQCPGKGVVQRLKPDVFESLLDECLQQQPESKQQWTRSLLDDHQWDANTDRWHAIMTLYENGIDFRLWLQEQHKSTQGGARNAR